MELDEGLKEALLRLAKRDGTTLSGYVRRLMLTQVRKEAKHTEEKNP